MNVVVEVMGRDKLPCILQIVFAENALPVNFMGCATSSVMPNLRFACEYGL